MVLSSRSIFCFSASSTIDGFSPLRITTMPETISSSSSCPISPCGGAEPTFTSAMSLTRIGVPFFSLTTTLAMSAEVRKLPSERSRNCCRPCATAPPPAFELPRWSAVNSSDSEIPASRIRARFGFTSYCLMLPPIVTRSATPGTWRRFFSTTQSCSVRSSCGE
ncbi:hypothetical protein D3C81_1325730 [compost metagenome]